MKTTVVAALYAFWLAAIEIVFFAVHGLNPGAQETVILSGLIPGVLQLVWLGFEPRGLMGATRLSMAFVFLALLSFVFNRGDWGSLTFMVELVYLFAITILFAGCPARDLLRRTAAIFSIVSGAFILFVDITGEYSWGRLQANGIEANFWGLMGLGVAIAGIAHRWRVLTALCIVVGYIVMADASSRSSMVGLAAAMGVLAIRYAATLRRERLVTVIGFGAVLLLAGLAASSMIGKALPALFSDIMKLDDPYRGVGQGFSGRNELWQAAIDLWFKSPLFGVGYRQHEAFLPAQYSAHNSYLAMLADTGIFGLLWYLLLIGLSLIAAWSVKDARTRSMILAGIVSYAVIGFFERRAINGGNPVSILFLMSCFYALAEQEVRQALRKRIAPSWVGGTRPRATV
jgi:O-antigen ligase